MSPDFLQHLKSEGFAKGEIQTLLDVSQELELPTRHILTQQGEVPETFYFVVEGICHACYLTEDGKAFSKEFYWEKDWVIGFESLIKQSPSPFLLETLTACHLICIPVEQLNQWKNQGHPIYYKLLETQLLHKESKERFMLLFTPEQRYKLFCEHYPELLSRLNDYQIAAYLGITPISLSRIKKRT
ncbi:Crp/Fnr family transcriptional regulator [Vibrio sonorensis]|uniref:Crp/Fnr family transcriptional regulator n=1 Tax=Vibrio sonorensis TaxID=1004316 RepID=UPI0008DB1DF8|nr:Crp/Fnr family transcriptional regulator [Vibrio sonorensis]